jgi:hypothetical protein
MSQIDWFWVAMAAIRAGLALILAVAVLLTVAAGP